MPACRSLRSVRLSKLQACALLALGAPPLLLHIVDFVGQTVQDEMTRDLFCLEYFSGVASIVKGFRELELAAQGVDHETDGCSHCLLGDIGFMYAIRQILRLKEGALGFWGLPCNSFGFMARSLHQRSNSSPFGCGHHAFVQCGNILITRMVALMMLMVSRQVRWMLEQPDRSAAAICPYLQHLLSFPHVEPHRVFWWMGYFGGWSCKPQMGLGNCRWMNRLFHPLEAGHRQQIRDRAAKQKKEMTIKSVQKSTQKRQVTGGRDLSSSAAYPRDFGREVACLHVAEMADGSQNLDLHGLIRGGMKELPEGCHWQHGNFDGLLQMISSAASSGVFQPDPMVPIQIQPSVAAFERLRVHLEEG